MPGNALAVKIIMEQFDAAIRQADPNARVLVIQVNPSNPELDENPIILSDRQLGMLNGLLGPNYKVVPVGIEED